MRKNVTQKDAERVLKALCDQQGIKPEEMNEPWAPKIRKDFDWYGHAPYAIVWEEGPFEWTYRFPEGGIDEESTILAREFNADVVVKTKEVKVPEHLFLEPITSWAMGIYLA